MLLLLELHFVYKTFLLKPECVGGVLAVGAQAGGRWQPWLAGWLAPRLAWETLSLLTRQFRKQRKVQVRATGLVLTQAHVPCLRVTR